MLICRCGWHGTDAPLKDVKRSAHADSERIIVCPECGKEILEYQDIEIEVINNG